MRLLLGYIPFAFPFLNHLLIVTAHGLTAVIIAKLVGLAGLSRRTAVLVSAVFVISSTVCATIFSIDGLCQAWSTTFGVLSVWAYLRFARPWNIVGWMSLAMTATLAKESGIAWFVAGPLLAVAIEGRSLLERTQVLRLGRSVVIGACGALLYFALRFSLKAEMVLGSESGRYALHLSPTDWLQSITLLVGLSTTTIDTLSVFLPPRNLALAGVSAVASLPLAAMAVLGILRYPQKARIMLIIAAALVVSSPHLLIEHPGEMHAYPTFAVLIMLLAFAIDDIALSSRRIATLAVGLFLLASIGVGAHKWWLMVGHSRTADIVAQSIDAQTTGKKPETVLVVRAEDNMLGYSVFYQNPAKASCWGMSVMVLWGWKYPQKFLYADEAKSLGQHYDAMWVIYPDGRVKVTSEGGVVRNIR